VNANNKLWFLFNLYFLASMILFLKMLIIKKKIEIVFKIRGNNMFEVIVRLCD